MLGPIPELPLPTLKRKEASAGQADSEERSTMPRKSVKMRCLRDRQDASGMTSITLHILSSRDCMEWHSARGERFDTVWHCLMTSDTRHVKLDKGNSLGRLEMASLRMRGMRCSMPRS